MQVGLGYIGKKCHCLQIKKNPKTNDLSTDSPQDMGTSHHEGHEEHEGGRWWSDWFPGPLLGFDSYAALCYCGL